VGFFVIASGWIAGCGSDTSASVYVPGTPSPAALQRAATAVPTATQIPDEG
jgi:hypothetical protein